MTYTDTSDFNNGQVDIFLYIMGVWSYFMKLKQRSLQNLPM